jgi:hypothetical protein
VRHGRTPARAIENQIGWIAALCRTNANDVRNSAARGDDKVRSRVTEEQDSRAFDEQRAAQRNFKNQPPRPDGDQTLVSRLVWRRLSEAVKLVALVGSEGEYHGVHVGRLLQQDVTYGPQQAVRLDRLRDSVTLPGKEVVLKVRSETVRVPFKDRDVMSTPGQEQSGGEAADTASDNHDARHIASPSVVMIPAPSSVEILAEVRWLVRFGDSDEHEECGTIPYGVMEVSACAASREFEPSTHWLSIRSRVRVLPCRVCPLSGTPE